MTLPGEETTWEQAWAKYPEQMREVYGLDKPVPMALIEGSPEPIWQWQLLQYCSKNSGMYTLSITGGDLVAQLLEKLRECTAHT